MAPTHRSVSQCTATVSYPSGEHNQNTKKLTVHIDADVDIIPLAFMNGITPPITNFASASDRCKKFPSNPDLLDCPEIA